MRRLFHGLLAGLVSLTPLATSVNVAVAADPVYQVVPDYDGVCGNKRVRNTITKRFRYQVTHVPNLPDVEIMDFNNVHEHRYEGESEESPIGRRYCGATVALSDGSHHEIWYLIEEGMGFATLLDGVGMAGEVRGSNVEFCVAGFDRWMVYNGRCRILR